VGGTKTITTVISQINKIFEIIGKPSTSGYSDGSRWPRGFPVRGVIVIGEETSWLKGPLKLM
jgi:hypothetical protein